ncbi:MAG: hypothetical protein AAFX06_30405, partial [Planctomycetota bacterium]
MTEPTDPSATFITNGRLTLGRRLLIVGLLLAMIWMGRQHASEWRVRVLGVTSSRDGSVWVGLVRYGDGKTDLWRWDRKLRQGKAILSTRDPVLFWRAPLGGRVLIVLGRQDLRAVDSQTGQTLWRRSASSPLFDLKVLGDDSHVLFVDDLVCPVIRVLDAESGAVVSEWKTDHSVRRYLSDTNTLVIEGDSFSTVLRWSGDTLVEAKEPDSERSRLEKEAAVYKADVWESRGHLRSGTGLCNVEGHDFDTPHLGGNLVELESVPTSDAA